MTAPVSLRSAGPDRVVVRPLGFLGDRFKTYLDAISGARFDPDRKEHVATIDKAASVLRRLRAQGFAVELDDQTKAQLDAYEADRWVDLESARDRLRHIERELATRVDPRSGKTIRLYDFQKPAIEWLSTRTGALLADEQGLGKTAEALCAIPAGAPVLVVCPSVVKTNWVAEAKLWRPNLKSVILYGRSSFRWPEPGEMVVTNYDILPPVHVPSCKRVTERECPGCHPTDKSLHKPSCPIRVRKWCPSCGLPLPPPNPGTVVVVDEVHECRNADTLRSESARAIGRLAREADGRSFLLTGTPIHNRPTELWDVLELGGLAHEAFGSWRRFVELYGGTPRFVEKYEPKLRKRVKRRVGYQWSGIVDPQAVDALQKVMLRRMRHQVLDLPPVTYRTVTVEIDKKAIRACDEALEKIGGERELVDLLGQEKFAFNEISRVRAILAEAKTPALVRLVECEYEYADEPVVVFSAHRHPIDVLGVRKGWASITGDTPAKRRGEIVEAFQAGELKGIALTIGAGGQGITLTRASFLVFVDQEWTPARNAQARDRIIRIGQKRPVTITTLVADHPIDARVAEVIEGKTKLIEAAVDAASVDNPKATG